MKDTEFLQTLNEIEKKAWMSFIEVSEQFLGNHKSPNYKTILKNLLVNLQAHGCRMSLKVYFLFNHLNAFPENLGDLSEEHGERFHQDLKVMEERYKGKILPNMLADFCWKMARETESLRNHKKYFKIY